MGRESKKSLLLILLLDMIASLAAPCASSFFSLFLSHSIHRQRSFFLVSLALASLFNENVMKKKKILIEISKFNCVEESGLCYTDQTRCNHTTTNPVSSFSTCLRLFFFDFSLR
jgi:uncharacterized membrane protein